MTGTTALVALHAAVALFGFAALFGKWLALPPEAIVFGRTVVAAATLALVLALQRASAAHNGASTNAHAAPADHNHFIDSVIEEPADQREGTGSAALHGRPNTEARAGLPTPVRPRVEMQAPVRPREETQAPVRPRVKAQTPIRPTTKATTRAINGALLAIHWVSFFAAVQAATVAIALLGFASFPVFVLALESVDRRRMPGAIQGMTVLLVAAGLAVLVPSFEWSSNIVQGLVWGIVSGLMFALLAVRNRGAVEAQGAVMLALWQNAFAAIWLVPWLALRGPLPVPTLRDAALVVVLGVACTALAHTLFIASMRRVSAHTASVVSVLEPVYGIVLAAALLGERPDLRTLAGMVLIVAAALLATRQATR